MSQWQICGIITAIVIVIVMATAKSEDKLGSLIFSVVIAGLYLYMTSVR